MIGFLERFLRRRYDRTRRVLQHIQPLIHRINTLEDSYKKLSDETLKSHTQIFKQRLAKGETLDDLLVEAFATIREASARVLSMRHFDVQMQGGIILHQGKIAEMKTGEGKTLVATAPIYLNALAGKGAHLVTVNDYLVQRDSKIMSQLYSFLGLSTGCIVQDLTNRQRKEAYGCDITYGTNNEFGFDYLRDNMRFTRQEMCQRPFFYAIVDEVDSILIDEARTPLIISGASDGSSQLYEKVDHIICQLRPEDYEKEEKFKNVAFTDQGVAHIADLCHKEGLIASPSLFESQNVLLVHHLNQALKAHKIFQKDVDYIIKDDQVMIIDEFTGRMMKGRRYSDGLHQALEAKEHVTIEEENQTVASITFQNYFRMYPKLSGMTGTALTEATEFEETYNLQVISIPTNLPVARVDEEDEIFLTFEQKVNAIVKKIRECHKKGQPVLIGTVSIESSEIFSRALELEGLDHNVLNARQHAKEAVIIAQAGMPGAITIATNMAGRGTDIKLGGNLEMLLDQSLEGVEDEEERVRISQEIQKDVRKNAEKACQAGGLFVIGTERHESRRIDNQLRGRSGRQGDPGGSKFYISLDDELMRNFGPRINLMRYSLKGTGEGESDPIAHPWLTKAIAKAQQSIEAQHFDSRKQLLKYSDILNNQRKAIYDERNAIIDTENPTLIITDLINQTLDHLLSMNRQGELSWNLPVLTKSLEDIFALQLPQENTPSSPSDMRQWALASIQGILAQKEEIMGVAEMARMERTTLLHTLDEVWIGHLNAMERLRTGIHLQAYGQKDPLNEYKGQAFIMFKAMLQHWHQTSLAKICHFDPSKQRWNEEQDDLENLSYQNHLFSTEDDKEEKNNNEQENENSLTPNFIEEFLKQLEHLEKLRDAHEQLKVQLEEHSKKDLASDGVEPKLMVNPKRAKKHPVLESILNVKASQEVEKAEEAEPRTHKKTRRTKPLLVSDELKASQEDEKPAPVRRRKKVETPSEEKVAAPVRKRSIKTSKGAKMEKPETKLNETIVLRTSLCPCGSGKRYKHCHGSIQEG